MNKAKVNESLYSLLDALKDKTKKELRVATFGYITKINKEKCTVNMQPMIKERFYGKYNVEYKQLPELFNLPYLTTLGTPKLNDYCVCIHLDRSIGIKNLNEEPSFVNSVGNIHDLSDGIVIFGFGNKQLKNIIEKEIEIGSNDIELLDTMNGTYDITYTYNNCTIIQRQILNESNNKIFLNYFISSENQITQSTILLIYSNKKLITNLSYNSGIILNKIERID